MTYILNNLEKYKYGEDKFDDFFSGNFINIKDLNDLLSFKTKCKYLICTINNIEYSEIVEIISKLHVDHLFVIIDSENIDVTKLQKELKFNNVQFFVIKKSEDWFIVRQKIDRIILGFNVCSDIIYIYVILLLLLLIIIPVSISLYFNK